MIAFDVVWIPVVLTILCVGVALRPQSNTDPVGIAVLARVLWLIPILLVWLVYLALRVWGGA